MTHILKLLKAEFPLARPLGVPVPVLDHLAHLPLWELEAHHIQGFLELRHINEAIAIPVNLKKIII